MRVNELQESIYIELQRRLRHLLGKVRQESRGGFRQAKVDSFFLNKPSLTVRNSSLQGMQTLSHSLQPGLFVLHVIW